MEVGIVTFVTAYGLPPDRLGRAVEERGFDGLFVTEHTHIPVSRRTPLPAGGELPRRYLQTFDPFVALTAAAAVTERIVLGTAVSLVAQHDPITLAKTVASVDRVSGGRVELGIGAGWNVEEAANHGAAAHRTARMLETVAAMREIWTQEEPEFHGRFVDFDPIWSWPKPVRLPPVLIGGNGPSVLDRVLSDGDGWLPLKLTPDRLPAAAPRLAELRDRAAAAGRQIPVTVYGATPTDEAIAQYADHGIDRVLFEAGDHDGDHDAELRELDQFAELLPGH